MRDAKQLSGKKPVTPVDREDREELTPCDRCAKPHRPEEIVWVGSARAWLCGACRGEAETCGCSD